MSVSVDFEDIPYDLYKILNLSNDCTLEEIKTNYKKALVKYHPDKDNTIDPEFFSYIGIAYKILSNPINRSAYDEWKTWKNDHEDLKSKFHQEQKNIENNLTSSNKESYMKKFKEIEMELNKKHGYDPNLANVPLQDAGKLFSELNKERSNISVPNYNINPGNINEAFDKLKENPTEYNQELIPASGEIMEFNSMGGGNFAGLNDIGALYKEGENLKDRNMSSMNVAFNLHQKINYVEDNRSVEEKMKDYENLTNQLNTVHKNKKI